MHLLSIPDRPVLDVPAFLRHAHYLPEDDRLLLDLCYRRRMTRADIARLLGFSVGTVSRRLVRLEIALRDPLVVALIESPDHAISPLHRSLGIAHFLCRRPANHLAKTHHLTPQQVRQILSFLQGWHRGTKDR